MCQMSPMDCQKAPGTTLQLLGISTDHKGQEACVPQQTELTYQSSWRCKQVAMCDWCFESWVLGAALVE